MRGYFLNPAGTLFRQTGLRVEFYGSMGDGWSEVLVPLRSDLHLRRISWLRAKWCVLRLQVGYWRFLRLTGAK